MCVCVRVCVCRVQNQVTGVIGIMKENISKVMDRGERLETLEEKSGTSQLVCPHSCQSQRQRRYRSLGLGLNSRQTFQSRYCRRFGQCTQSPYTVNLCSCGGQFYLGFLQCTGSDSAVRALVLRKLLDSFLSHRKLMEASTVRGLPSDLSHAHCVASRK